MRRHNALVDVLSARLDKISLFLLRDQLDAFNANTNRLAHYDQIVDAGMVSTRPRSSS